MKPILLMVLGLVGCHGPNICYKGHSGTREVANLATGWTSSGGLAWVVLPGTHKEDTWICDFHTEAEEKATGKHLWKPKKN